MNAPKSGISLAALGAGRPYDESGRGGLWLWSGDGRAAARPRRVRKIPARLAVHIRLRQSQAISSHQQSALSNSPRRAYTLPVLVNPLISNNALPSVCQGGNFFLLCQTLQHRVNRGDRIGPVATEIIPPHFQPFFDLRWGQRNSYRLH